jgi:hypothetical protein
MKFNPGTLIVPFRKLSADCYVDLCITVNDSGANNSLIIGITWKKQCVIKSLSGFYINKGTIIQRT